MISRYKTSPGLHSQKGQDVPPNPASYLSIPVKISTVATLVACSAEACNKLFLEGKRVVFSPPENLGTAGTAVRARCVGVSIARYCATLHKKVLHSSFAAALLI